MSRNEVIAAQSESTSRWDGEFISIQCIGSSATGKTRIWAVWSHQNRVGEIRWFSRWRRYSFYPAPDTVFEQQCLRDIAAFIERETMAHKSAA